MAISTKSGDVRVLNEMLPLDLQIIVFDPVAANRQNFLSTALDGDDVRKSDSILILKTRQVIVRMNFKQLIAVIVRQAVALLFRFLLLYVREDMNRIAKLHFLIEPGDLQLLNLVLGLTHHMRYPLCVVDGRCSIGHHHVFCGEEDGYLPTQRRVVIDLLKRRAS